MMNIITTENQGLYRPINFERKIKSFDIRK